MGLKDLTDPEALTKALNEFDAIGRDAFLDKYGFGKSKNYFVFRDGKEYDSKAIIGAAHGYQTGTPLAAADFSGGSHTVQPKLRKLGFEFVSPDGNIYDDDRRLLDASFEVDVDEDQVSVVVHSSGDGRRLDYNQGLELILGRLGERKAFLSRITVDSSEAFKQFPAENDRLVKIGGRSFPLNLGLSDDGDFSQLRIDIARSVARTPTAPLKGGGNGQKRIRIHLLSSILPPGELRDYLAYGRSGSLAFEIADPQEEPRHSEGQRRLRVHYNRERSSAIVRAKKRAFLEDNKRLFCEICKFDFQEHYPLPLAGNGYAEAHHVRPLSEILDDVTETKLEDLILVCSNCHRMIHRTSEAEKNLEMLKAHFM
jgi:5-methylcytosine-specific restriction enzyme A